MAGDDMDLEMEGEDMLPRSNATVQQQQNATAGPSTSAATSAAPARLDMIAATAAAAAAPRRNRSPTPPRALFRSTTGKGVAFTQEDVTFLVRFMEYRKSQGALDMVAFWKDVATKVCCQHYHLWRASTSYPDPMLGTTPLTGFVDEVLAQAQARARALRRRRTSPRTA